MPDENKHIHEVTIEVGQNIYARLESLSNTPSHVLAEFVDNAFQSYVDNKDQLLSFDPGYRLRVDINFEWGKSPEHSSVSIRDNAAGIPSHKFLRAFALARTPDNTTGLNEFGMGMKTAALWIGKEWQLSSTAYGEDVVRTVSFDLNDVVEGQKRTLPVDEKPADTHAHLTTIVIRNFTKNAPTLNVLSQIGKDLASIYRQQLRNNEIEITLNGLALTFEEYPILQAPFAHTPDGPSVEWKKEIDFSFDNNKYRAKGFIAILREMNKTQNGLVLLRRGRVVYGAEEGKRYCPKSLFGNVGSPRFKRLFGELELEGFSVSFNKDDLQEKEDLEALMQVLRGEIHTREFDLYAQAEDYRPDDTVKKVNRVASGHKTIGAGGRKPTATTRPEPAIQTPVGRVAEPTPTLASPKSKEVGIINDYEDKFELDGTEYTMKVQFMDGGTDLLWLNIEDIDRNVFECRINAKHPFYSVFSDAKIDKSAIAILRAMAMAKFAAMKSGNNDVSAMFSYFNDYIRDIGA